MTVLRRVGVVVAMAAVAVAAGCTPEEVALFRSLTPEQQAAVIANIQHTQRTDCRAAIRAVWPEHLWGWADKIVSRESGFRHDLKNRSSSASGCFQLLQGTHGWRYGAVGCPPDPFHALCNSKAAWMLYSEQGARPWAATDW